MAERDRVTYETEVVAIGEEARAFLDEGIVVLFGEDAPEELHEISVIHRPALTDGGVEVGGRVSVDGHDLHVLAVGEVANENLHNLGHLILKRNGKRTAPLPGDVCCDEGPIPSIEPGSVIRVLAPERS